MVCSECFKENNTMDARQQFSEAVKFHGFSIADQLITDIIETGSKPFKKTKRKPIIGIHFHCCVDKDTKTVTEFNTGASRITGAAGWNHWCRSAQRPKQGKKRNDQNVYLDPDGSYSTNDPYKFDPSDHPNTVRCGLWIDFHRDGFEEGAAKLYRLCYGEDSTQPIAPKPKLDVLQHASCSDGDSNDDADISANRKTYLDYLNRVFCSDGDSESLFDILKQHEQHISSQCSSFGDSRMYFYLLSHTAFFLFIGELYAQLRSASLDRDKRDLGKRVTFLLTKKKKFISRLYFHFVAGSFDEFDRTEFIGVSDENRTHLLGSKPCTQHTINAWKLYAQNRVDEQSLAVWNAYEAYINGVCAAHCNMYSFMAGHALAALQFKQDISRKAFIAQSWSSYSDDLNLMSNVEDTFSTSNLRKRSISQREIGDGDEHRPTSQPPTKRLRSLSCATTNQSKTTLKQKRHPLV